MIVQIIDNEGFYLGINTKKAAIEQELIYIETPITISFIKPKWNGIKWIEGATEEEITQFNTPVVPASVTKRQLKQALVLAGIPLVNIDYTISQITDDLERELMTIFWNDSTEFERYHPKLIEFAQQLQISEQQANELFILASTL